MPDHCRQRPRSCRSVRLARTRTANLVVHRPIHRFVPTPTTVLRAKAIASTAPARPPSDQRRGQFPIALAAPSVPYPPQFRALALFGRRPPERVVGIVGAGIRKPAHERPSEASFNADDRMAMGFPTTSSHAAVRNRQPTGMTHDQRLKLRGPCVHLRAQPETS